MDRENYKQRVLKQVNFAAKKMIENIDRLIELNAEKIEKTDKDGEVNLVNASVLAIIKEEMFQHEAANTDEEILSDRLYATL